MAAYDHAAIRFARLSEVDKAAIIELMNDPQVRRHMPLARGGFGPAECDAFVAAKERQWQEHGYGPWAFIIDGEFGGWGGIQDEGGEADVGLVLRPKYWGWGRVLYERIIAHAFGELGFSSVIVLLPPSRTRISGVLKLGFRPDGELTIAGERFLRYRLTSSSTPEHGPNTRSDRNRSDEAHR
jgi:hypothetical protein